MPTAQQKINTIMKSDSYSGWTPELNALAQERDAAAGQVFNAGTGTYSATNSGSSQNGSNATRPLTAEEQANSGQYISGWDYIDGGGPGASGATYGNVDMRMYDTNNDGFISFEESDGNIPGGIDGGYDDGLLRKAFSPFAETNDGKSTALQRMFGTGSGDSNRGIGGLFEDLSMGVGYKDADQGYYERTLDTIRRTQGYDAADRYFNSMKNNKDPMVKGFFDRMNPPISNDQRYLTSDEKIYESLMNDETPVDETPVDDGDGDGEEEEIEYTQMPPFFGGYQRATRESTLVDEPGRIGSFKPNPRLDPIYPQRPPFNEVVPFPVIDDGSNFGFPGEELISGPRSENTNALTGQPQTTPMDSEPMFNSLAELDAYQQQNPHLNLMTEYQRLRALEGGIPAVAELPQKGVASLFGNGQAPRSMYQGIMG